MHWNTYPVVFSFLLSYLSGIAEEIKCEYVWVQIPPMPMKTRFSCVAMLLCIHFMTPVTGQTNDQLRETLQAERDRKKILSNHIRKNSRIEKYIYRRGGRNIRDVVFDFDKKVFVNEPPLTADTLPNPPFEIHEMDGLRIKVKNLNPFIYTVDLFELQGDQISNEKLLENSQTASLKVDVPLFKEIEISALALSSQNVKDSADYNRVLAERIVAHHLYDSITVWEKKRDALQEHIEIEKFKVRNSFDHELNNALTDRDKSLKNFYIQRNEEAVRRINARISQVRRYIGDQKLDSASLNAKLAKESVKLRGNIKIRNTNQLKLQFSSHLSELKDSLNRINQFIFLHNSLVGVTRLATNNYDSLKKVVNGIFRQCGIESPDQFSFRYLSVQQSILRRADDIKPVMRELMNMTDSLTREQLRAMDADLNIFLNSFKSFDHLKLVNNIALILGLISEANFQLTYETLSIAENADFVKYRIEFKPNALADIPVANGPFNLEMSFLINEGLKVDVSTGIILDFNLADPTLYFQKFSSITPGGEQVDSVRVKRSPDTGKITPSINLMLNAYKRSSLNFKPGVSLGFGVSNDIRFRLYAGPSLIIGRKERIMISGGAAFGAVLRAADGYHEGATFQDNTSVPVQVPMVQDKFKFGWFFGAGFNFSGKDTKGFVERIKFK